MSCIDFLKVGSEGLDVPQEEFDVESHTNISGRFSGKLFLFCYHLFLDVKNFSYYTQTLLKEIRN